MNCDPREIVKQIACMSCMNRAQSKSVSLGLVCDWARKAEQYPEDGQNELPPPQP